MSTYRFDKLLAPRSIALVGSVAREGSLGRSVLDSLPMGLPDRDGPKRTFVRLVTATAELHLP